MTISSESKFHFTHSIKYLEEILNGEFRVSYCLEKFVLDKKEYSFGMPMVSFCDIPLSQVSQHINKYGGYGIGLSNKWALTNRLNPVLYIQDNSHLAHLIEPFYSSIINLIIEDLKDNSEIKSFLSSDIGPREKINKHLSVIKATNLQLLIGLFSFIKNYQGKLIRKGEIIEDNYKFYKEREWRYVPKDSDNSFFMSLLTEEMFNDWRGDNFKDKPFIKNLSLKFEISDISFILVKEENEITYLVKRLKSKCSSENEFHILMTKFLTIKQLNEDF